MAWMNTSHLIAGYLIDSTVGGRTGLFESSCSLSPPENKRPLRPRSTQEEVELGCTPMELRGAAEELSSPRDRRIHLSDQNYATYHNMCQRALS